MNAPAPQAPVAPVAVGYDDSAPAARALEVAADEATLRGAPLVIVIIAGRTRTWSEGDESCFREFPLAEQRATVASVHAVKAITRRRPGLTVEVMVAADPGAERVVHLGRQAQLLVLGSHGQSRLRCLAIGSMSAELARPFDCPVFIVREADADRSGATREGRGGLIVVGLDGTERTESVMTVAAHASDRTGRSLLAVHAFVGTLDAGNRSLGICWGAFSRSITAAASQVGRSHTFVLAHQDPVRALCERVTPEDLLVIGTRGHGRLAGLMPSAVSRALLDALPCDVLIVPSGLPRRLDRPVVPAVLHSAQPVS